MKPKSLSLTIYINKIASLLTLDCGHACVQVGVQVSPRDEDAITILDVSYDYQSDRWEKISSQ